MSFLPAGLLFLATAADPLPTVADVAWAPFRDDCRRLLRRLDEAGSPLPDPEARRLKALLADEPSDPARGAEEVQRLLDARCLLGVTINPEARVKAARGPAAATLVRGRESVFLVKVENGAGVTARLAVRGPGLGDDRDAWLAAALAPASAAKHLSGRPVEYLLIRLTPREAGKREATFSFDAGQGTQDLGFRAEVPVLFTVRTR